MSTTAIRGRDLRAKRVGLPGGRMPAEVFARRVGLNHATVIDLELERVVDARLLAKLDAELDAIAQERKSEE